MVARMRDASLWRLVEPVVTSVGRTENEVTECELVMFKMEAAALEDDGSARLSLNSFL